MKHRQVKRKTSGNTMEVRDYMIPKSWREMSYDFKLFSMFDGCMMLLFIIGRFFPILVLIGIVGAFFVLLAGLSIHHKVRSDWHWPGVGIKGVVGVVFSIGLGLFFLGAATPRWSPLNPTFFPWFAVGGSIILFSTLFYLKIVFLSESEFQSHCGDQLLKKSEPEEPEGAPPEPTWKKAVRAAFFVYFAAAWIAGVSSIWKSNSHSIALGIPSVLLIGALIHFVVGVKLLPGLPTLAERMKKNSQTEDSLDEE